MNEFTCDLDYNISVAWSEGLWVGAGDDSGDKTHCSHAV